MPRINIKYSFLLFTTLLWSGILPGQPAGYYSTAEGLTGTQLQQALHNIIDNHSVSTYTDLWTHFQSTDKKNDGKVWDMYSDVPGGTPFYEYIFVTDQCGNYAREGDCYNREHSFPKSWFNDLTPMYTDLFHLYPTDGSVNGMRGNYPFGVTSSPSWISTNGSRLGYSSYPGYTGMIFEPINSYKGDFARSYFYMAVRYYGEDSGWTGSDMVTGSQLKPWALNMLMNWDLNDPVSQKEKDRNNAVYLIQGNRNPFIDYPDYTGKIWGTQSGMDDNTINSNLIRAWPNPATENVTFELPDHFSNNYCINILDVSGRTILNKTGMGRPVTLDVTNIETGFYIVIITSDDEVLTARIVVSH